MKSNKKAVLLLLGCAFLGASGMAAATYTTKLNGIYAYVPVNTGLFSTDVTAGTFTIQISGAINNGGGTLSNKWLLYPSSLTPGTQLQEANYYGTILSAPTQATGMTWTASVLVNPPYISNGPTEYTVQCDIGDITATLPPWNTWSRLVVSLNVPKGTPGNPPILTSCHMGFTQDNF